MSLPRSLQAQLDEADRIVSVLEGETPPGDTPPQEQQPEQPEQPIVPVVTPQPPVVTQVDEQPEDTWKQKYRTLKGIFDAEKTRLDGALNQLGQQVQQLSQDNANMRAALQQRQEAPVKPAAKVTDADRETFGAELVDLIERAATPQIDRTEVEAALRRIADLEGRLGQVSQSQTETATQTFWKHLTKDVPDWKAINDSDAWKGWLLEVDPVYGVNRQAGLDNAFDRLDVDRVATIFATYKATLPAPKPTPQQELQRQVTPTRSRASNEPLQDGQAQGMIWTDASIKAFYADLRRGVLTTEQAAAYEEDLNRAATEGRIRA